MAQHERPVGGPDGSPVPADASWGIVEAAPDGIVLADEHGTILLVNGQVEALFGYDRASLVGSSVDELLPEWLREVHRDHRTRYRSEPRTRSMGTGQTLFGRRHDGTEFPVEISLSPLTVDGALRIVAVIRDVSDRIELEAAARRIKEILDATRDAVMIFDADTLRFTYVNQGAVDQVGYSVEEMEGMTMLDITPEFDDTRLRELLAPLERGELTSVMFTTTHRRRDGTDLPVEIILQATDVVDGRPRSYVKIVRDIAARVADEERLREAEQSLRLVEDRDRIARDLHDMVIQRLFAVGLAAQGVQARQPDPDTAQRLAGIVDELDTTIREIRTVIFGLQRAGTGRSSGLRADVLQVIADERVVMGFEPRVTFDGIIDTTPPEVASQLLATLREALSNVGQHARAVSATVNVTAETNRITLHVQDDGVGIGDDSRPGNGIANLRRRAEELGGECEIGIAPGGGTSVAWSVPLRPDPG